MKPAPPELIPAKPGYYIGGDAANAIPLAALERAAETAKRKASPLRHEFARHVYAVTIADFAMLIMRQPRPSDPA